MAILTAPMPAVFGVAGHRLVDLHDCVGYAGERFARQKGFTPDGGDTLAYGKEKVRSGFVPVSHNSFTAM